MILQRFDMLTPFPESGMNMIRKHRDVSIEEVASNIHLSEKDALPHTLLSVSPCRSGTTVMLRVFGASGVPSHFQELKNVLRWRLLGEEKSWQIPKKANRENRPGLYLKETLGPFLKDEAEFNPLEVLLQAGFPKEKLHLLIIGREVQDTWASWKRWWPDSTDIEIFVSAYQKTEFIRKSALEKKIPVTTWVYESLRDFPEEKVIKNLFQHLDIPFNPYAMGMWDSLAGFGEPGSNIVVPNEPGPFITPNIHAGPMGSPCLMFFSRKDRLRLISQKETDFLLENAVHSIYENWKNTCYANILTS